MVEGTQVGAYRVLHRIGEGGMGSVWLAEHMQLGRRAAIKVLHAEYSNRADMVNRFFNEARAATAIADPGIVQVFDFGQHSDGSAYLVMELLDGEPLDRRLARCGALGLADALRVMRQVASTLAAAHARGIVHRDLKPENVFMVRDAEVPGGERAKILDFGIAKLMGEHGGVKTSTSTVMGTPTYMSPEQCRGAGQVDQRSDVYSLGCMLFTILVGRPPFDAEGPGDMIAAHLREPAPPPSSFRRGIPPEVDRVVLRCLAKDPQMRFEHGGELAVVLGALLGSSPHLAPLGPGAEHPARSLGTTLSAATGTSSAIRPARSRRVAALVGLGVAAAGAAVAVAVTRGGPDAAARGGPGAAASGAGSSSAPAAVAGTPAAVAGTPAAVAGTPAAAPAKPDPGAAVAARTKDVLSRFVAWSREHRGAPCPDVAALGDPPPDPWGHAFRITCTDQPGDQIVGAISAGPDGEPGTADDIASWLLGGEVTGAVRGARWVAAVAPPPSPAAGGARPRPAAPAARPAEPGGARRPQPRPDKGIELDENGLPIKR